MIEIMLLCYKIFLKLFFYLIFQYYKKIYLTF